MRLSQRYFVAVEESLGSEDIGIRDADRDNVTNIRGMNGAVITPAAK